MNSDLKILILALVILAIPLVSADDLTTTISISSEVPELSVVNCDLKSDTSADDTIDLSSGNTVLVECNVTADDKNGHDDMNAANGTLCITTQVTGDIDSCYLNSSCLNLTANENASAKIYTCHYSMVFHAEPGSNWNATMNVNDTSSATTPMSATRSNPSITVATLSSIDVINTTLAFSAQALGANTSHGNSKSTLTNNTGNIIVDATFQETSGPGSLSCTSGTLEVDTSYDEGIYFNETNEEDFRIINTTKLTSGAVAYTKFDLVKTTDSGETPNELWWRVRTPFTGITGTCTGTTQILLTADS